MSVRLVALRSRFVLLPSSNDLSLGSEAVNLEESAGSEARL